MQRLLEKRAQAGGTQFTGRAPARHAQGPGYKFHYKTKRHKKTKTNT